MPRNVADLHQDLQAAFRRKGRVLVAYSGGVDSALLAAVGARTLGSGCLALLVDSESLAPEERAEAEAFARAAGVPLAVAPHQELADPAYAANPVNRCYFCRKGMSGVLKAEARRGGFDAIAVGTHVDDARDIRPGDAALAEEGVWRPYLDLGMGKADIRALARHLDLPVWDKPPMACLSSRIPHGEPVTLEKLTRIGRAEGLLRARGFREVRVRTLEGGHAARIEVAADQVPHLQEILPEVTPALVLLGYARIEVDPRGYRTGSLHAAT